MSEIESRIDNIELVVATVLQVSIAIISLGALVEGMWLIAFAGAAILLLSFAPAMIERRLRVPLPVEFTLLTCIILFASFVLGEVRDFYERIWWWDLALHGLSAMLMGFIGFLTVYVFHMTHRLNVKPFHVAAFSFGFAVTIGTLWEIFEFLMDWYVGTNMQKSGLVDTMTDLIINAIGALVAAITGYLYVRNGDSQWGRRLFEKVGGQNQG